MRACEPEQYRDDEYDVEREIDKREEEIERETHPERFAEPNGVQDYFDRKDSHPASCSGKACDYPALAEALESLGSNYEMTKVRR
jgi:hypothetical protein